MRQPRREVVVTGAGVLCHFGDDLDTICADLRAGRNTPFRTYDEAVRHGARCHLIGIYPNQLDPAALGATKQQSRFMGRASLMALHAARNAVERARVDPKAFAVVVGSGAGDVASHQQISETLDSSGMRRVSATIIPKLMASTVSANLVNVLRTTGPSFTASAACAGGAYNIILAAILIEKGIVDGAIAGGVEVADPHFFAGFDSMRAYNGTDNDHPERASRPYARDRAGFIFSEGAGIVVLEALDVAQKRGADVLGVLRGYGMSSDGVGEMVAPSSEGAEAAMRRAIEDARITAEDIDYVNTHGTSTPLGDISEVRAMRRVFSERNVLYSSTKGYTGHPVSAAGAIEAIFTLEMLRGGWIAPAVNARPLDPEIEDYPPVLESTDASVRRALSNSFGFGGTNACLILEAA
ncbi:MAG TPA: beta-ketoacyl-[acyl-carrier-protein] synthase family protein [Vicinamibacteria bacterium]|nr:beta-ketoacyl-[acyl-carrier-protein] synthase family protein [Vicinamibacteria bacterium]